MISNESLNAEDLLVPQTSEKNDGNQIDQSSLDLAINNATIKSTNKIYKSPNRRRHPHKPVIKRKNKKKNDEKILLKFRCCDHSKLIEKHAKPKIKDYQRRHQSIHHFVLNRFICLVCLLESRCILQSIDSADIRGHLVIVHGIKDELDFKEKIKLASSPEFMKKYNIIKRKDLEENQRKYNVLNLYNSCFNNLDDNDEFTNLFKEKLDSNDLKLTDIDLYPPPALINNVDQISVSDQLVGIQDDLMYNVENLVFNLVYSEDLQFKTSYAIIRLIKEFNLNDNVDFYDSIFGLIFKEFIKLNGLEGLRDDGSGALYSILDLSKLNLNKFNLVQYIAAIRYFGTDEGENKGVNVFSTRNHDYNLWLDKKKFKFKIIDNLNRNYKECAENMLIHSIKYNLENIYNGSNYLIYGWSPTMHSYLGASLIYISYLRFKELVLDNLVADDLDVSLS